MPPGETAYSFANVTTVAVTRASRPALVALATFSTSADDNIGTTAPPGQTDGEVLDVEDRGSDWLVTTLDDHYDIPRQRSPMGATRWYVLEHGVLSVAHAGGNVSISRFDGGKSTATWTQTFADPAIQDATIGAWLPDAVLLAVTHATDTRLIAVQLADGKTHTVASIPAKLVVLAPSQRAGSFVAVFNKRPECALCARVEVRALTDGHVEHSFELPDVVDPFPPDPVRGNASVGFDGRQVWFFSYAAPHHSDVTGTSAGLQCSYDVFDATTGTKLRSLANAAGEWASLSRDCRTHALISTGDGGAIALSIDDAMHATATKFATAP
jgi:hypothetical protein